MSAVKATLRPRRAQPSKASAHDEQIKAGIEAELGRRHNTYALLIATQCAANHDCEFDASDTMAAMIERVEQHIRVPGRTLSGGCAMNAPGVKATSRAYVRASAAAIERSANGSRRFAQRASGGGPRWLAGPMEALKKLMPAEQRVILRFTQRAAKPREYAARTSDPEFHRSFGGTRHQQPVFGAPRASELRRFSGETRPAHKPQVSAEFCVKRSRAFCAGLAKDRTRDNASLSAPKETETHHDWRNH